MDFAVIFVRCQQDCFAVSPPLSTEDAMAKDCASCTNFTSKEYLDDYLAKACGEAYCGLCRMKSNPARGAFILNILRQRSCREWAAEEMALAA